MDVLYLGGTFDQLNMPVLASFETVAKRIHSIVDAYSAGSSGAPDWGNAKLFAGYTGSEDVVMPQLKTWAARRGKEEVELYQARHRLLRYERWFPKWRIELDGRAPSWTRRFPLLLETGTPAVLGEVSIKGEMVAILTVTCLSKLDACG